MCPFIFKRYYYILLFLLIVNYRIYEDAISFGWICAIFNMAGLNQNFSARRKEMLIYCFGRLTGRSIEGLFLKPHIRGHTRDSPKYFKTLFHGNKLPHIRGREKHAPRQAHSFHYLTYGGACVIPPHKAYTPPP